MTTRRLGLRGTTSLKRRTTPRETEPIRPENYATAEKPIGVCCGCQHHTSAFAGRCTAMVPGDKRLLTYCGCDCREHLNGDSDA